MSRIRTIMGDSQMLWFYELDHDSMMRLLKPTPTPLNGLAMKPGKREQKQLKETQTLQQDKPPINNLPRTAGVAVGGGLKMPHGKQSIKKALWQSKAKQALVKVKGNTGANTRDKSWQKTPSDHWQGGGLDEETTNTRNGR